MYAKARSCEVSKPIAWKAITWIHTCTCMQKIGVSLTVEIVKRYAFFNARCHHQFNTVHQCFSTFFLQRNHPHMFALLTEPHAVIQVSIPLQPHRAVVANFVPGSFGLFRGNPRQPLAEPRLKNTAVHARRRGQAAVSCISWLRERGRRWGIG